MSALLQFSEYKYLNANDNSLLEGMHYTRDHLAAAVEEAWLFHNKFLTTTEATMATGLHSKVVPDWAPKLLRRCGIAGAVIEKLGAATFSKRLPQDKSKHLAYVQWQLEIQAPLVFRIAHGPLKNIRLNGPLQLPDLAEYLTFMHLARVMASVAAIYPHGVIVQLVPDDKRATTANRCTPCYVSCYIGGLRQMARDLNFDQWLRIENGQEELYRHYGTENFRQAAIDKLNSWKEKEPDVFAERWMHACENSEKNFNIELMDPTPEEVEAAAWRYLVAHQSEVLSGIWSADDAFPLLYANHPGNYQLYTLGTKKSKLPWQVSLPFSLLPEKPF